VWETRLAPVYRGRVYHPISNGGGLLSGTSEKAKGRSGGGNSERGENISPKEKTKNL